MTTSGAAPDRPADAGTPDASPDGPGQPTGDPGTDQPAVAARSTGSRTGGLTTVLGQSAVVLAALVVEWWVELDRWRVAALGVLAAAAFVVPRLLAGPGAGGALRLSRGRAAAVALCTVAALASSGYLGHSLGGRTAERGPTDRGITISVEKRAETPGAAMSLRGRATGLRSGEAVWVLTAQVASSQADFPFAAAYPAFGPCGPEADGSWWCDQVFVQESGVNALVAVALDAEQARRIVTYRQDAYWDQRGCTDGDPAHDLSEGCWSEALDVPGDVLKSEVVYV
jgi:hypothetical protein